MKSKADTTGRTSDTVIILGAGFSLDAGIPLMNGFVDKMWELANRRQLNGVSLSKPDLEIFDSAMKVRYELNEYHGRAAFDDRNIEDLLSILSFNNYLPQPGRPNRLAILTKAIARTIELCCAVKHPGIEKNGQGRIIQEGSDLYRRFWQTLLNLENVRERIPALITLNYDLVLERAFFQAAIGTKLIRRDKPLPFSRARLLHYYDPIPLRTFELARATYGAAGNDFREGTILKVVDGITDDDALEVDILKLHGSLNFPSPRSPVDHKSFQVTQALDDPFILPPIFNKQSSGKQQEIWRRALLQLRGAKNVIIVGYSLPKTDIYMQYFLKAALGPNVNLNRIFVFDPALYRQDKCASEMEARYAECFAPQLQSRISFRLPNPEAIPGAAGTTSQFIYLLENNPGLMIF
jgi:hypothetical protein